MAPPVSAAAAILFIVATALTQAPPNVAAGGRKQGYELHLHTLHAIKPSERFHLGSLLSTALIARYSSDWLIGIQPDYIRA
jgi:hypothetical protein